MDRILVFPHTTGVWICIIRLALVLTLAGVDETIVSFEPMLNQF
jgi:hypothetical protein